MARKNRLAQVVRFAALSLLAFVVFVLSLVQVQQHRFRHRAELLLNDMRNLWMHPGTFDDLRHLQQRWGAFGHYEGTCTEEHCEYTITLTSLASAQWKNDGLRVLRDDAFALFGGRSVDIQCGFVVHKYTSGDLMIVRIRSASRLFAPDMFGREADLKRGYEIGSAQPGTNARVHITPQTSVADIKRLTDINLGCITRIRPCVDMDDLLPEAWSEFRSEHNEFDPSAYETRCSVDSALFAREADNLALVEVLKLHAPEYPSEERTQGATVRILESLKNNVGHPVGSIADVSFGGRNVYVGPGALSDPNRRLAVGDRVFLLYPPLVRGQSPGLIDTGSCSLIPLSDTTLKSVRAGISMDRSNDGLHDISIPY
jgi:hypothetical protein